MRSADPPQDTSQSLKRPTSGFAVSPLNPSDPPHLSPTVSSETDASVRTSTRFASSSRTSASPASNSSPGSCARRNRMFRSETSPSRALKESSVLFSHPSPTTSTPPALGWRQSAASRFAVISWSAPSWLQP